MVPMTLHALPSHPGTLVDHSRWALQAGAVLEARTLTLRYVLAGAVGDLRWPVSERGSRLDGLWRTTCFEAFIGLQDRPDYLEFNLAPGGGWACYLFNDYRSPVPPCSPPMTEPKIEISRSAVDIAFTATLSLADWPSLFLGRELCLGLCAVLQACDGTLHYHALSHPRDVPDFHDRRARLLRRSALTDGPGS